jgi:dihydrofolate reductase
LNSLAKYVVSSTLVDAHWTNATALKGDVVDSKLKQEREGEIVVYASRQLVHTLMEHDLVDELRLIVFPFVLGAGERLFGETSDKTSLRLLRTRPVGESLAYLSYEVVREAQQSGGRVSNPRPRAWEARALPAELPPQLNG